MPARGRIEPAAGCPPGGGGNCGGASGRTCSFTKVNSPICSFHRVTNIYQCEECERYHVCDGEGACHLVETRESLVCALTGRCMPSRAPDLGARGGARAPFFFHKGALDYGGPDGHALDGVLGAVQADMARYFSTAESPDMEDVRAAVLLSPAGGDVREKGAQNGHAQPTLRPEVEALIRDTFPLCRHVFAEASRGYDIICSMYVHIIISVYATKTVYGNLLFKCTKNKKYNAVVKRMREAWMSTLITGAIAAGAASTS
nr:protein 31 [Eptesicus fuscus gammaherpesvirus]